MRSVDLHGGLAAQGGPRRGSRKLPVLCSVPSFSASALGQGWRRGDLQRTGIDGRAAIVLIGSAQQQGPLAFLHQGAGAADFAVPTEYLGGCDVYAFVPASVNARVAVKLSVAASWLFLSANVPEPRLASCAARSVPLLISVPPLYVLDACSSTSVPPWVTSLPEPVTWPCQVVVVPAR